MQHTFCDVCGQFDLLCRCDPLMDQVYGFQHIMDVVMIDRRPRHWLWREEGRNPPHDTMVGWFDAITTAQSPDAWHNVCLWAVNGSPVCQEFLDGITDAHKVIEELNRYMDELDDAPICPSCDSTDLCGCSGRCPRCTEYECTQYECCAHIPGAEDAYRKTIGCAIPVRMRPTTNMQPTNACMRSAMIALFESCAIPFSQTERSGLDFCNACQSHDCDHCICPQCGEDTCEHFFVPPPMTPALWVAFRNGGIQRIPDGSCFCTTCNAPFECPDWDPNPMVSVCNGDCDTCRECIAAEIGYVPTWQEDEDARARGRNPVMGD